MFQSSPGLVTGRYLWQETCPTSCTPFQSSPGLVTGRYMHLPISMHIPHKVSILARSGDRALHALGPRSLPTLSVSILARSGDRALLYDSECTPERIAVSILARSGDRALLSAWCR